MGCAGPNPVITRLSAHGRTPRGLSRLVLRIIQSLQNLAGGIEMDETVFRISEPVADGTHRKRPENGGTTCEKQNHPRDCAVLGFPETTDAFGVYSGDRGRT